jgi:hypothetical protein
MLLRILKITFGVIFLVLAAQIFWALLDRPIYEKVHHLNRAIASRNRKVADSLKNQLQLFVHGKSQVDTVSVRRWRVSPPVTENTIDLLGYSERADQLILKINNNDLRQTPQEIDGSFFESDIYLGRGLNTIRLLQVVQRDTTDTIHYEVMVKGDPVPFQLLSSAYDKISRTVTLMGTGEPDSIRDDSVIYFNTNGRGIFHIRMSPDEIGIDSIAANAASLSTRQWAVWLGIDYGRLTRKSEFFVDSSRQNIHGILTVTLPTNSILIENLSNDMISWQEFTSVVFGDLEYGWRLASLSTSESGGYTTVVQQIKPNRNFGELQSISLRPGFGSFGENPLMTVSDSLILHIPRTISHSLSHSPTSSFGDKKIFVGPKLITHTSFFSCRFPEAVVQSRLDDYQTEKARPLPENLISLIREFPEKVFDIKAIPHFDSLLWAFSATIPMVLLLFLVQRHVKDFGAKYDTLKGVIILFMFLLFVSPALEIGADIWRFAERYVRPKPSVNFPQFYLLTNIPAYYFSFISMIMFYPVAAEQLSWPENERKFRRWRWVMWIVFGGILIGCMYLAYDFFARYFGEPFYGIGISMAILLSCAASVMVLKVILRNAMESNLGFTSNMILAGCLLTIPILLNAMYFTFHPDTMGVIMVMMTTLFGAFFLYTILKVVSSLVAGPKIILTRSQRLILVTFLLITALPKSIFFESVSTYSFFYPMQFLLWYVRDYFALLLLIPVVYVLRERGSAKMTPLDPLSINLAFFLIPVYVIGLRYYYMFIPITLVLGYFLCTWLLFEKENMRKAGKIPFTNKDDLEKILAYFDFRKRFKAIRKSLDKSLDDGTIDYKEWKKKSHENEANLKLVRTEAEVDGVGLRQIVFSRGIEATRWANAVVSIRIGALAAIPWIYMQLRELRSQNIGNLYPMLSVGADFIRELLVWFVIAMVFGYYFDRIRGRGGLEKALWLSLIIIASSLGPAILFADNFDQAAFIMIWCVKVFVYLALLGFFAFDFRIFRKHGYGWREVEITYNLAYLSTYGSTLAAALVGLLSGKLESLFGSILTGVFG